MLKDGEQWRVIQADCLEVLKTLPDGCVDAVVTDPPYGIAGVWKGGVAAIRTGRRFIGIEKDSRWCDTARRRIAEAAPLFVS